MARDPWFVALWFVVVVVVVGCIVKREAAGFDLLAAMTVAQKSKSSPKLLPCAAKHEAMGAWLRGGWVVEMATRQPGRVPTWIKSATSV